MFFINRRFLIARFVLIIVLLAGLFGAVPAQAASTATDQNGHGLVSLQQRAIKPLDRENKAFRDSQLASIFPTVTATSPGHGDVLLNNPASISVQFSTNMLADGTAFAVNKATNYLLVEDGADGKFQTTSCVNQLGGDDTSIAISTVSYNPTNFTSTLTVPA